MANIYVNQEDTPANTDDALEGPQRIREIKQAFNERLSRDHFFSSSHVASPVGNATTLHQGADSADSGYHRRITIKEEQSAQGSNADTRLNGGAGVNDGTDATKKMAEIWVEKHSGTSDETSMLFLGTEGAGNQRTVVTTTQTQTLTNKTLTSPIINDATLSGGSGSIDGIDIGTRAYAAAGGGDPEVLAGAAAGKFTTLESTGDTTIGAADSDTLILKAATSGLSSDASGYAGANKFYAGLAGEIKIYAGSSLPQGWLWCDGAQYVRVDYAELFDIIGLTYSDIVGTGGNTINNSTFFRVPNLAGRIPIGSGTGLQTDGAELKADTLTARALGDYGADETYTLTASESGAGPHYHPVHLIDPGHDHDLENIHHDWAPEESEYHLGIENANEPTITKTVTSETTGITIKANHELDVTGTTETSAQGSDTDDVFRTGKTNLNTGVPAASAHTQMQPFIVMNYIIKY